MNPWALRVLYELLAAAGLNPAFAAADVPDTRLVELVEGANPLRPGRALDLGIGDGYTLIVDSGCYYGLSGQQREAYAAGVSCRG